MRCYCFVAGLCWLALTLVFVQNARSGDELIVFAVDQPRDVDGVVPNDEQFDDEQLDDDIDQTDEDEAADEADDEKECKGPEPWIVSREPYCDWAHLDCVTEKLNIEHGKFKCPVSVGAWHWFHQSLIGQSGGYGIPGLRDTYFWYLFADPVIDLGCGKKIGGHLEQRFRETDLFRTFVPNQLWPWEAYGYIEDEHWGKLKAGLLYNRFGLFWDGVFFGNAPYFDGLKLDADYGISWESTKKVNDCFKVDRYVQFFFHEDASNGSFGGGDAESVIGYSEENTGVVRLVPTWTRCDGSTIELGFSGLVGQINSRRPDLADETTSGYAVDITYTRGPWKLFAEGSQVHGLRNPVRYVSGGPSNRLTNFLAGAHYTHGSATYRCTYSNSIDRNPYAIQNMVLAGVTITLTKHLDLYIEYVNERVDGADIPGQNGPFFHSIEYVINWHF